MPRRYRRAKEINTMAENMSADITIDNSKESIVQEDEIKTEDLFKVQNPTNAIIDNELNRIWGYLKTNAEKEKKIEDLINNFESISKDIEKFKLDIKTDTQQTLSELKNAKTEVDIKAIINKVAHDLFASDEFMDLFTDQILKELRKTNKISLLFDGKNIKNARFEFGFARSGNIVFFNKAFNNILWHLPNEMSLVTKTGFVAIKDAFWIVIGEDSAD